MDIKFKEYLRSIQAPKIAAPDMECILIKRKPEMERSKFTDFTKAITIHKQVSIFICTVQNPIRIENAFTSAKHF